MSCDNTNSNNGGNAQSHIPLKVGEPLSTACQRAHTKGTIPEVLHHPGGFTLVNGQLAEEYLPSAGIQNKENFFRVREGCYQSLDSRSTSSDCS